MSSIFSRRSIRQYETDYIVTDEELNDILSAGMSAPTARNAQDWEFLVIRNRDNLDKIMKCHPYANMLKLASLAIVVCGNTDKLGSRLFCKYGKYTDKSR